MAPKPDPLTGHYLPDLLSHGLRLWFVGTGAGPRSAQVGAYYAHPGNRFWPALHEVGLTPRRFEPSEFSQLLDLSIGLTDMCKTAWGVDAKLPKAAFDPEGFRAKVTDLQPAAIAFTSKTAASHYLGRPTGAIMIGHQPKRRLDPGPEIFVLPSPSGLATSYWSLEPWQAVADWFRS